MKTYFKIFLLSLSLFITSCSDDMFTYKDVDDEDQKAGQMITGAGDCITNNWSWSNGEASVDAFVSTLAKTFSFKTTVAGKLSFSYAYNDSNYRFESYLKVTINGKIYFNKENDFPSNYSEISIGSIQADETVIFSGNNCKVKNIKIVEDK